MEWLFRTLDSPASPGEVNSNLGHDGRRFVKSTHLRLMLFAGCMLTTAWVMADNVKVTPSNGVSGAFIGGQLGEMLNAAGLTAYAGPPTGYVLTFSNGLVVYLSGDTGITAEQESVVQRHYGAKLVVMNIGDTYTTGPKEAAFIINELIKPNAVIASHANEVATRDGKVIAGTRTHTFVDATNVPVHLPLSGKTMEFGPDGKCVSGC